MASTPFGAYRQYVQAGAIPSVQQAVNVPLVNQALYNRMTGLALNQNGTALVSAYPLEVPSLNVTQGIINGVNLAGMVTNIRHATKVADVDEVIEYWDSNINDDFYVFDSMRLNTNKTTVLKSRWEDDQGIIYGLVETTYNLDLGLGDETQVFANYMLSRTMSVYTYTQVVVIGVTYNKANSNIFFPNTLALDITGADGSVVTVYYPIREIWGADIYGTTKNGPVHILSLKELSNPETIDNVPAILYAPFITKISLKRRLSTTYCAFSGVVARSIYMPNLESIVGASSYLASPIFCSLNCANFNLDRLSLPSLKKIKNCMFACNNLNVNEIDLPALEELDEVYFLRGDILLKEAEFPKLQYIKGCNYFMANCYNLEKLVLPTYVKFMPHDPVEVRTQNSTSSLVRGTLTLLGLDTLSTGTTNAAMQYFLHADTKLMNAAVNGNTPGAVTPAMAAPYDRADIDVAYGKGIFFNAEANNLVSWWFGGDNLIDNNHKYGACLETFDQWAARVGYSGSASFSLTPDFTVTATSDESKSLYYYMEKNTGMIAVSSEPVAEGGKIDGTYMITPIDPRTALFNTIFLSNERSTAVHSYEETYPAIRFVENSSCYEKDDKRFTSLIVMLGINQYYYV